MNKVVINLINHLNVAQKFYTPPPVIKPDLQQYPVEFPYLVRCLHNLGDDFFGFMIYDIPTPSLNNCIYFSITKQYNNIHTNLTSLVNCFIITNTHINLIQTKNNDIYTIVYKSLDNLFYPIIPLSNTPYLFYKNNKIILQLLSRLTQQ